jgi:hypothetical protein
MRRVINLWALCAAVFIMSFSGVGWAADPLELIAIETLGEANEAKEDTDFAITYDSLLVATNYRPQVSIQFRIVAVLQGQLKNSDGSSVVTPALFSSGDTLTWIPPTNVAGDGLGAFSVRITSDGVNDSAERTVRVNITAVNDPPTFSVTSANQSLTVNEGSGAQTLDWATGVNRGGGTFEDSQKITFVVTAAGSVTAGLFAELPNVVWDSTRDIGVLTYKLNPQANGEGNFTVVAKDDGTTGNGGKDTSTSVPLKITVTPFNDRPTWNASPIRTAATGQTKESLDSGTAGFDFDPPSSTQLAYTFVADSGSALAHQDKPVSISYDQLRSLARDANDPALPEGQLVFDIIEVVSGTVSIIETVDNKVTPVTNISADSPLTIAKSGQGTFVKFIWQGPAYADYRRSSVKITVRDLAGGKGPSPLLIKVFLIPSEIPPKPTLTWLRTDKNPATQLGSSNPSDDRAVTLKINEADQLALKGVYSVRRSTDNVGGNVGLIFKDAATPAYTLRYTNREQTDDPENPPAINLVPSQVFNGLKLSVSCVAAEQNTFGHMLQMSNTSKIRIIQGSEKQSIQFQKSDGNYVEVATCSGRTMIDTSNSTPSGVMTIDCLALDDTLADQAETALGEVLQAISYINIYGASSITDVGEAVAFSITVSKGTDTKDALTCYRQLRLLINNAPPTIVPGDDVVVAPRGRIQITLASAKSADKAKLLVDDESLNSDLSTDASRRYRIAFSKPQAGVLKTRDPITNNYIPLTNLDNILLETFDEKKSTGVFYEATAGAKLSSEKIEVKITEDVSGESLAGNTTLLSIRIDALKATVPIVVGDPLLVFTLPSVTEAPGTTPPTPKWETMRAIRIQKPISYTDEVIPFIAPEAFGSVLRIDGGNLQIDAAAANLPPVLKLQIEVKKDEDSSPISCWPMIIKLIHPEPASPPVPSAAQ